MSVYFKRGKGWRYDFTLNGSRHTGPWLRTKQEARQAEARKREVIEKPPEERQIPTDMGFLELVNRRLDFVRTYNSEKHYSDYRCYARRWVKQWGKLKCEQISRDRIQTYITKRARVSNYTANKDLRYLRATFNFGVKSGAISANPTQGIPFLPVEKRVKYVPPKENVAAVILAADPDTQDYLWTIKETMARVSEINRLTWADVDFKQRSVVLYTRKKKGGHLTPRKVPMTNKLYEVLSRRYGQRDKGKPWVFWHRYWSRKDKCWIEGPYQERKRIMKTLCKRTGVRYFRFHSLRHFGASTLDNANVNLGAIQRILGHENRSTTEIYLHSIGEAERDAMRVFEEMTHAEDSHTNSHTDSHIVRK
jgi:integrase